MGAPASCDLQITLRHPFIFKTAALSKPREAWFSGKQAASMRLKSSLRKAWATSPVTASRI
jgi:hypothetical protein